ncbi:LysR family transcriptional regulator [Marinomonas epiphytica]
MMKQFNWKNIDLNLLVAFQTLYRTKSVSKAAKECYISQSAMSHTLQRLRSLFDDSLFHRKGAQMQPTRKAREIYPIIEHWLETIKHQLFTEQEFIPNQFNGTWRIGLTDYAEQLFSAHLFDAIRHHSPNASISFYNVNKQNYLTMFEEENLDIVIGSITPDTNEFQVETLYIEDHLCLYDPSQLALGKEISATQFASIDHALVSADGRTHTQVDEELKKFDLQRNVVFTARNFLTVRQVVSGRKLICVLPKHFAQTSQDSLPLAAIPLPVPLPTFEINLIFYKNFQEKQPFQWLSSHVKASILETIAP